MKISFNLSLGTRKRGVSDLNVSTTDTTETENASIVANCVAQFKAKNTSALHKTFGKSLAARLEKLSYKGAAILALDNFVLKSNNATNRNCCISQFEAAELESQESSAAEHKKRKKLITGLWYTHYHCVEDARYRFAKKKLPQRRFVHFNV